MNYLAGKAIHYAILAYLEEKPRTRHEIAKQFWGWNEHEISPEYALRHAVDSGMIQIAGKNEKGKALYAGTKEAFDNLDVLRGLIK